MEDVREEVIRRVRRIVINLSIEQKNDYAHSGDQSGFEEWN